MFQMFKIILYFISQINLIAIVSVREWLNGNEKLEWNGNFCFDCFETR